MNTLPIRLIGAFWISLCLSAGPATAAGFPCQEYRGGHRLHGAMRAGPDLHLANGVVVSSGRDSFYGWRSSMSLIRATPAMTTEHHGGIAPAAFDFSGTLGVIDATPVFGHGGYANGTYTTYILDFTYPGFPVFLSSLNGHQQQRYSVAACDPWVLRAHGDKLEILDVSDRLNPEVVNEIEPGFEILGFLSLSEELLAARTPSGTFFLDKTVLPQIEVLGTWANGSVLPVPLNDQYILYPGATTTVVDISDPTAPQAAGNVALGFQPADLAVLGDQAIVVSETAPGVLLDLSDPLAPVILDDALPLRGSGIVGHEGRWFVANQQFDLFQWELKDPRIEERSRIELPFDISYGAAGEKYFVAYVYPEFRVFETDEFTSSGGGEVGSFELPNSNHDSEVLAVRGDFAFSPQQELGVAVIDLAAPAGPEVVHYIETPRAVDDLDLRGDFLYVTDRDFGVEIINIADPRHPVFYGSVATSADEIRVRGDVAATNSHFIDVSDPLHPRLGARFIGFSPWYLADDGSFFVSRALNDRWIVYSLEDINAPKIVGEWDTGLFATDAPSLSNRGGPGLIAGIAGEKVLEWFDVTDPSAPRWRGGPGLSDPHGNLRLASMIEFPHGLLVGRRAQWWFVDYPCQGRPLSPQAEAEAPPEYWGVGAATPNPTRATTGIDFTLSAPAPRLLDVFDVAGRRVRSLQTTGELPAGDHRATWDGRDERGAPVAAGTYFLRLRAGENVSTQKVTVLR